MRGGAAMWQHDQRQVFGVNTDRQGQDTVHLEPVARRIGDCADRTYVGRRDIGPDADHRIRLACGKIDQEVGATVAIVVRTETFTGPTSDQSLCSD